jgi:1-acyl-sn-glycerol-3-phosphate acyltransferase
MSLYLGYVPGYLAASYVKDIPIYGYVTAKTQSLFINREKNAERNKIV